MENNFLQEIAISGFIARAIINDYSQVVSKIENIPSEDVKARVLKEAERLRLEFINSTNQIKTEKIE